MKISFLKIVFALVFFFSPFFALAGSEHNLSGYAWSSNIGWISLNCTNVSGSCTASNYGVNKDASGNLTGYAWSSNIGWIQFGGLSGFPTGDGTYAQNAQVVGTQLRGWAKALSADGNSWDGWISLTGTGYGVTQSGVNLTGFAWGSTVVGWINFNISSPTLTAPVVTTSSVTITSQTTATSGGTITSDGGAPIQQNDSGIVWGTTENPTLADNFTTDGSTIVNNPWLSNMAGLTTGVTYHVRAYAKNSMGTGYGPDITFTPTVDTGTCSDGIQNGNETGIDTGGRCGGGGGTGTCSDGIRNGNETGIDTGGRCGTGNCFDGQQNGDETGVDIGGRCGKKVPIFIED